MNLTTNTRIQFTEAVFSGNYRKPRFEGERTIIGTIVKESYGNARGQHTFTILVEEVTGTWADDIEPGTTIRRKGRNVYRNCQVLALPANHAELAEEKADRARAAKEAKYWGWIHEAGMDGKPFKLDRVPSDFIHRHRESITDMYPNLPV